MFRQAACLILLLASALGPVRPAEAEDARLRALVQQFRTLLNQRAAVPPRSALVAILKQIAALNIDEAWRQLAEWERDQNLIELQADILQLFADAGPDNGTAAAVFRAHLIDGDPHREMARDLLLARAVLKRDEAWLRQAFRSRLIEDRFLALRAMGDIGAGPTLDCAAELLRDTSWVPAPDTHVSIRTIALSTRKLEGTRAARLLMLMARDPRFKEADAEALRDATRLWETGDLRRYIRIADLGHPQATTRAEAARFMGEAGIETARAPLMMLAFDVRENPAVRGAAAEALGGLRIARGALARRLIRLTSDDSPLVRGGALAGLARLRVQQSIQALVDMLDTTHAEEARRALGFGLGLPPDQDWKAWLQKARLPEGT